MNKKRIIRLISENPLKIMINKILKFNFFRCLFYPKVLIPKSRKDNYTRHSFDLDWPDIDIYDKEKSKVDKTTKTINFKSKLLLIIPFIILLNPMQMIAQEEVLITLKMENVSLGEILKEIKEQSGKSILFNNNLVDKYKNESIVLKNKRLEQALEKCLEGKDLQYKIIEEVIIIEPKNSEDGKLNKPKNLYQTIRGRVIDLNTGIPLMGANILLVNSNPVKGAVSDANGYFKINDVPIGRQGLEISYLGYGNVLLKNLYVLSGKELVLEIKLEEKVIEGEEIIFRAFRKDKPINDMAQVSARSFSVEETERYAGSIGDPSRMAAGFAGVLTMGTQINDIIIRGNSTTGLLWRMENLRIPNPNHFGDAYSTGGTSSMLNNNVLSNSDFYTGAFPAEFGDALSGVFDMNLRKGNTQKREHLAQIGFGGLELGTEGPIKKGKRASYIANYRYSTMAIFGLMGLEMGIDWIPFYQDLSYNVNIPTGNFGRISVFGVAGKNNIGDETIDNVNNNIDKTQLDALMGFTGVNQQFYFNENSSISTAIGVSFNENEFLEHQVDEGILDDYVWNKNTESTFEFLTEYKNRINNRNYIKLGFDYFNTSISLHDSIYLDNYDFFIHTKDIDGNIPLIQSYIQWKHRFSDNFSVVSGVHYQYSQYGNDHAIEPRFSFNWDFLPKQSLSLGFGAHSKLQPKFIYHEEILYDTINEVYEKPNKDLKMSRSKHIVLGYNYLFNNDHRLKVEAYYQYLDRIPVERDSSYKSLINFGNSFSNYDFDDLVNKGVGYNYGLEFTLEKFLSKGYYYLFTMSLFESKYKGSDGVVRNTKFNANAIFNLLGGYEWIVKEHNTIGIDGRLVFTGGERKIPLDYEASAQRGEAVPLESRIYDERFKNYLRFDFRFFYKINKKTSHTLALDVLNATCRNNHFLALYDKEINDYKEESILSIIPAFLWRWNF